jgi:hypothetical protein
MNNNSFFLKHSSLAKVKDEKRPWILRAREAAAHVDNASTEESSETWPKTLIYISCGWESFKKVRVAHMSETQSLILFIEL